MKFKRQRRFEAEVSTSSLNDIMFFLLLFFLIVSTLGIQNSINLNLPKASKSNQEVSKEKPVVVSIDADKKYYIDETQINFPELEEKIKAATANMPQPAVILRFDKKLTIQDLIDVMSIGAKSNIKMTFATEISK
jgi:biopolymer transport protein ExbD